MTSFHEFLTTQIERGGFTTEDVLVSFLPLMRQVIGAHEYGDVAPLQGIEKLQVEGVQIWFAESDQCPQRRSPAKIRRLLRTSTSGVEVVGERRVTFDVHEGVEQSTDLRSTSNKADVDKPIYVAGYLCWEHMVDHHDPSTDVFSLGLILASLACSLDLSDPDDHERFVSNRTNLFRVNPALHPVLARAIVVMTELDRHDRPQDLSALLATLEDYRDQEVDFETDFASGAASQNQDRPGKRRAILSKLQERLFEINRRNRLLQFRSTLQTVNLTHASIPIAFDASNIREDQVLTWSGSFRDGIVKQKAVLLNSVLNFRESVYLPGVLDRIRAEARRDETEYGFAQLRLIICFLRWTDLKSNPPENYESPLLMVPVKLDVKKGIHDRYYLTALDGNAEVNPVIRHLFKQLYEIELPEAVDLSAEKLDEFFDFLRARIKASDSSVQLRRVDKPRIELIHEKARRRLDQFRRRARLSGRGIRHFMDLDYSYDPINYHPLGLRVFEHFITPAKTHLEGIISTKPPQRRYLVPDNGETQARTEAVVEAEQQFYNLKSEGDDNPFNWEFDLCSVTLANLKYRRMSLVRDYTRLVNENVENAAFEATFSINPADRLQELPQDEPLQERFHVVPCDPTQREAVTRARAGQSYIIQGPPGTGKSQTITNLIADFVVRGQRVLFVCEKRAAIDVVYHRLKQEGLSELCCLIHDSQADKKQFVMDLKQTYDAFLAESSKKRDECSDRRNQIVQQLQDLLAPVADFNSVMTAVAPVAGVSARELLNRLIELRESIPTMVPKEWERVPTYATCLENRKHLLEFADRLRFVQPDGVLVNHPLCLLRSDIIDADQPIQLVTECADDCVGPNGKLNGLIELVDELRLPSEVTSSLRQLEDAIGFAQQSKFLADDNLFDLLDPESRLSNEYSRHLRKLDRCDKAVAKAQKATAHWRNKLTSEDTQIALDQARQLEGSILRLLKPGWWRLNRLLKSSYDFSNHAIKPTCTHILQQLDHEHEQLAARYDAATAIADEYSIHIEFDRFHTDLQQLQNGLENQSGPTKSLISFVLQEEDGSSRLRKLADLAEPLRQLTGSLNRFVDDYEHRSLVDIRNSIEQIRSSVPQLPDYLHCLTSLREISKHVRHAIRTLPLTMTELEAASAKQTLETIERDHREAARYSTEVRSRQLADVAQHAEQLQSVNAAVVRERARQRFVDHVETASKSATQLSTHEKEFKKIYSRGRKQLEHEFGKSMRYKAIRELADGESGVVIRDLKPVWLMSPLSVSDTLPLESQNFDVVIFDEASQITLEEAIPSLFRAEQTIVVGDEMQLPPTSFFATRRDEDEELSFEEEGEVVQYDLNSSSFLNHASRNLPSRMLGWHYRSRSESLISFSNHAFYGGRLLTVPEERLTQTERSEFIVADSSDARTFAEELLDRPVSFHFLENGVYEKRRNKNEAEYIAELVRTLLFKEAGHSIGIVAFSEAQQDEIDRALRRLADEDSEFSELLELELEREEDGQFVGLLVKNLENIQGDERDIIVMSVCYGPDPQGKIRMNFGPINLSGGEKRLNVAFSRAKHCMALVTSMRSSAITNEYNDGANCLKNYLRYAEACSAGREENVSNVLNGLSGRSDLDHFAEAEEEVLASEIAETLQSLGYQVDRHIGQSHFQCDLAIYKAGDVQYRLGILIDGQRWYSQTDLLERELMKPQLLRVFGWNVMIVLAREWVLDRESVTAQIEQALAG